MSALGHKRTFAVQNGMSALPPKADMCSAQADVRFVPIFDHLRWLNILDAIKRCDSNLPTIVCPVQQSLPLPRAAKRITGLAV